MYNTIINILRSCDALVIRPGKHNTIWVGYRADADWNEEEIKATYDAICRRAYAVIDGENDIHFLLCGCVNVNWTFCEIE